VFNFTNVNIPAGVTIRFARNSRNTPVVILASGDVTVAGTLDVSGSDATGRLGGAGGPGGFDGGAGGIPTPGLYNGTPGDGPGGGAGGQLSADLQTVGQGGGGGYQVVGHDGASSATNVPGAKGGSPYGTPSLQALVGGSGGGGGAASTWQPGPGGGGGGGAILIACSGTIAFGSTRNQINASGGGGPAVPGSSGGSGGVIRVVATKVTGDNGLYAGTGFQRGYGYGSDGWIRVEAFDLTEFRHYRPWPNNVQYSKPNASDLAVPAGSPTTTVALEATNVAPGATAMVRVRAESGVEAVVESTPFTGSFESSTAAATLALPAAPCLVVAVLTTGVNLPYARRTFADGEVVARIEISAGSGAAQRVTYVTESGRRVTLD
jgi:hypothetical protein